MVAEGFGLRLYVRHGALYIDDCVGPNGRRARLLRSTSRGLRIVLYGRAGSISIEALRFMAEARIGFALIDAAAGRVISSTDSFGLDIPRLRRLQALATDRPYGMAIAKSLIHQKISGQLTILQESFQAEVAASQAVSRALGALDEASDVGALRVVEAEAAARYFEAWRGLELRFVIRDEPRVAPHWRGFPARSSPITGGPRLAACGIDALLNLGYALGEVEARMACLAMGLDPGIGIVHADQSARDSLALDVLEAIRPSIDRWVLNLMDSHTFKKADFIETTRGVVRVSEDLARVMADTLPQWRRELAPVVEAVANSVASASDRPLRLPTKLSESRRSKGREGIRRGESRETRPRRPVRPARACPSCGEVVGGNAKWCDACRVEAGAVRDSNFVATGRNTLARMRASGSDPAQTAAAKAKRSATVAARNREVLQWERQHADDDADLVEYERRVLPCIKQMTLPQLQRVTGLSRSYCWQVRRGDKTLHPRFWSVVARPGH